MSIGTTSATHDRPAVNLALLAARVIVGIIFVVHGWQKVSNLQGVVDNFGPIGYLVTLGEFGGGLGLILGILSRFSAASLIVIMIEAIRRVHLPHGFMVSNGGFEYNLALIGLLTTILLAGPGIFTIGRFFLPKSGRTGRPILVLE
jgi:putative oxidoreductase